jgi:hypothetical protein
MTNHIYSDACPYPDGIMTPALSFGDWITRRSRFYSVVIDCCHTAVHNHCDDQVELPIWLELRHLREWPDWDNIVR